MEKLTGNLVYRVTDDDFGLQEIRKPVLSMADVFNVHQTSKKNEILHRLEIKRNPDDIHSEVLIFEFTTSLKK